LASFPACACRRGERDAAEKVGPGFVPDAFHHADMARSAHRAGDAAVGKQVLELRAGGSRSLIRTMEERIGLPPPPAAKMRLAPAS